MKVVVIGSGNVAEAFATALMKKNTDGTEPGVELVQICSRGDAGKELARKAGVAHAEIPQMLADADLYILAVSDAVINEISTGMDISPDAVVAHVAGGVDIDEICSRFSNCAVIYPLQTFTKGREVDLREVPFFIEYTTPEAERAARTFAAALTGKIYEADSQLRVRLHTAAVFACNFVNYMYTVGANILKGSGLGFDVLKPLIKETAAKAIGTDDPATIQTGPAVRGDERTMRRHLQLLEAGGHTGYEEIYKLLSEEIWETLKKT